MADVIDMDELVAGSVDSIVGKFDKLDNTQLQQLHDLEQSESARSTLLGAIHREFAKRGMAAAHDVDDTSDSMGEDAGSPNDAAIGATGSEPELFTREQVDAQIATALANAAPAASATPADDGKLFTRDQVDAEVVAERARVNAEWEAKVNNATTAGQQRELFEVDPKAGPVGLAVQMGAVTIVFVGFDDRALPELGQMTFHPGDWKPSGSAGTVLDKAIDFPVALPFMETTAAFIVDGDCDTIGKASLMVPFPIGGGRSAKLPAGTLLFE